MKGELFQDSESVRELSSLAWQIVANHEDVQSRKVLTAAFKSLPMSNTMKKGSQLSHLWPTVCHLKFDYSVKDEEIAFQSEEYKSQDFLKINLSRLQLCARF